MGLWLLPIILILCPDVTESRKLRHWRRFAEDETDLYYPHSLDRRELGEEESFRMPITSFGLQNPCDIPPIEALEFSAGCTSIFRKGYICNPPETHLVSVTVMDMVERALAGNFAYCRYDAVARRTMEIPIGDDILISEEAARRKKQEDDEKKNREKGIHAHPPGTRERIEPPEIRPRERRFKIAIMVFDNFRLSVWPEVTKWNQMGEVKNELEQSCNVDVDLEKLSKAYQDDDAFMLFIADVYGNATLKKFTHGVCESDIAVLILASSKTPSGVQQRRLGTIYLTMNNRTRGLLADGGKSLEELVRRTNTETSMGNIVEEKLVGFFKDFSRIVDEQYPKFQTHIIHTIPRWAVWAFALSILISVLAVIAGNCVNSTRKRSSSTAAAKPGGKQWGAGFSGGMWKK